MSDEQIHTLNIAGKDYALDSLSDEAKAEIQNLRFAETEIQCLSAKLAMAQTARNAYLQALMAVLPQD